MPNTITDKTLGNTVWQSANTLSGIAVGTAMKVQNKSSKTVLLWIGTQPVATATSGIAVPSFTTFSVPASESEVWLFGNGTVSIQL